MLEQILAEIKTYQNPQIKKIYQNHGIQEPVWGVKTGDLKKIIKQFKLMNNHQLALQLYETNIYEAMYLAGLIEDEDQINFNQAIAWLKKATSFAVGEFIIASIVSETLFVEQFIEYCLKSKEELEQACGYATLALYVGLQRFEHIDKDYLINHLITIKTSINSSFDRVKYNMNSVISAIAISRPELTQFALEIAKNMGKIEISSNNKTKILTNAEIQIEKAKAKNRIGFRRKTSRCY